jgi:predicted ArsR family transcriptional regulator
MHDKTGTQKKVLDSLLISGESTMKELATSTGISKESIKKYTTQLIKSGKVTVRKFESRSVIHQVNLYSAIKPEGYVRPTTVSNMQMRANPGLTL